MLCEDLAVLNSEIRPVRWAGSAAGIYEALLALISAIQMGLAAAAGSILDPHLCVAGGGAEIRQLQTPHQQVLWQLFGDTNFFFFSLRPGTWRTWLQSLVSALVSSVWSSAHYMSSWWPNFPLAKQD